MFRILVAGAALAVAAGCGAASAATITLYNTGVDDAGTPLANGNSEQHYVLVGGSDALRTATDANGYPMGYWAGDDAQSDWIGPATNGSLDGESGATYDYRITFSLAGLDASHAVITGKWLTDDSGVDILINGQSTGARASGFSTWSDFTVSSGFRSGDNTLDFLVHNDGGPTGLRVEMSGDALIATAGGVPEPACWALMISGFGLAGVTLRRRRSLGAQ